MQVRVKLGRTAFVLTVIGLALELGTTRSRGSEGPPPVLNPKSYTSASGQFTLHVDPSDLLGRGGASYRLTRTGQEVWSGKKDFTLWDARVTDEGIVAGYAYSHGWRGFSKKGISEGMGDFRALILDQKGSVRLERVTKREEGGMHSPPNPLGLGLILDAAHDRVVIRVYDPDVGSNGETWRTYRLSDGEPLAVLHPLAKMRDPRPVRFLIDAKPLAGTPLTLLHWWRSTGPAQQGARFTLVGVDAKPVWSLDLMDDYAIPNDEDAESRLQDSIRETGALLRADKPGEFDLWFVKKAKRVTFSAKPDGKGAWTVVETGRSDEPLRIAAVKKAQPPTKALRSLGRIELKLPNEKPASPIRDVHDFDIDDQGRIAFLRVTDKAADLVVIDRQGAVLRSVPLDPMIGESGFGWTGLTWVGGDRYVLSRSRSKGEAQETEAWWVDAVTTKVTQVPGSQWPVLSLFAGRADGGFVVREGLRIGRGGYVPPERIVSYNAKGVESWRIEGSHDSNSPRALFSPEAIAVNAKGDLAVVDVIRHLIQWFDRDGKFQRSIDLAKAWGHKPNYPSGLAVDRDGGLVVHDFGAELPLVRIASDGKIRAAVRPTLADGRVVSISSFHVAPDGRLWVSDRSVIARLADSGVVDRVLGDAPEPDRLGKIGAITIDRKGKIYAVDEWTAAVHVFDADGKWLRVAKADPKDFADRLALPQLTISDGGDIYLGAGIALEGSYLRFSPEGKRLGFERLKLDDITETWYFQPGTGRRLVLGYEKAFLVDGAGAIVRTIERRPDNMWLDRPNAASFAPDGSFSISALSSARRGDRSVTINLYADNGDPIRTITLPGPDEWSFPQIAYNGKHVAVVGDGVVLVLSVEGRVEGRFSLGREVPEGNYGTPYFRASDSELLIFDYEKTLHRFALP